MSGMLFLMFVQSLFHFVAQGEGGWQSYYEEKNYFDMPFAITSLEIQVIEILPVII